MKKLFILFVSFILLCLPTSAYKLKQYYIKKTVEGSDFLCFSKNKCYNITPTIIRVNSSEFVGFGGYHYFDIASYKHNINSDTYSVDVLVDRDPSTDYGYYTKCPYDDGYITHLIFSIKYIPAKKIFKAEYKGFLSSKTILAYENGIPSSSYVKYLNIYYNNKPELIKELRDWLNYYNKDIIKTFGKKYSSNYDIEIIYIIKHYILSNS